MHNQNRAVGRFENPWGGGEGASRKNLPPDWNIKLEERGRGSPSPQGSEGPGEIQLKREVSVQFSSCKSFHFPPFCSLGSKTLIPVLYARFF
jgi:hypothetical protein